MKPMAALCCPLGRSKSNCRLSIFGGRVCPSPQRMFPSHRHPAVRLPAGGEKPLAFRYRSYHNKNTTLSLSNISDGL